MNKTNFPKKYFLVLFLSSLSSGTLWAQGYDVSTRVDYSIHPGAIAPGQPSTEETGMALTWERLRKFKEEPALKPCFDVLSIFKKTIPELKKSVTDLPLANEVNPITSSIKLSIRPTGQADVKLCTFDLGLFVSYACPTGPQGSYGSTSSESLSVGVSSERAAQELHVAALKKFYMQKMEGIKKNIVSIECIADTTTREKARREEHERWIAEGLKEFEKNFSDVPKKTALAKVNRSERNSRKEGLIRETLEIHSQELKLNDLPELSVSINL